MSAFGYLARTAMRVGVFALPFALLACKSEPRATLRCDPPDASRYYGTVVRSGKPITTFYVNNGGEPEYLDPGLAADGGSSHLVQELFEGLATKHPVDAHPVQAVAVRWEVSADNRIYRFHLRPEARWSDGRPVVAGDFVYAWSRVLSPASRSRSVTLMYPIKNGALFHQQKLKVLTRVERLRPAPDGQGGTELAEGAAVRIVGEAAPEATWIEVEAFAGMPTFRPAAEKPTDERGADSPQPARGYVPADALASDPRVLGVRAASDRVLEVELEEPTPYFLELTTYNTYFPVRRDVVERFEKLGQPELWTRPENIVTNGAYTLESWKFRYELTLVKNPHHYDRDRLKIDRIVWVEVADYQSTLNLYQAGEIDWIGANLSLPQSFMDLLETKLDFSRALWLSSYWYEFNIEQKPVDDVRVRRALNLGIDKQLIVDKITRADQMPATHFVPPYTGSGYDRALNKRPELFSGKGHDFDPALGRKLLTEAGYPVKKRGDGWHAEGFPDLEILYNTSEGHRAIAVAIQDMWRTHLGISATLRNEEFKVLLKNIRDGHFRLVRLGWTGDYNHPHSWLDTFLSYSHNNHTGWKNPRFDALIAEAARTADPDKSIALYLEAEALAVEEMPKLPVYFYTKSSLVKPWVRGYWDNASNNHAVRWMWIDPDWCKGGENTPAYAPEEFPPPGRITR